MLGWKAHIPGYRTKEDDMDLLMDKYNFPMNAVCLRLDSVTAGQFAARLRRAAEEADLFESHIIPLDMGKMILLNSQSTLELNTTPFPPPVNMFLKQKIKFPTCFEMSSNGVYLNLSIPNNCSTLLAQSLRHVMIPSVVKIPCYTVKTPFPRGTFQTWAQKFDDIGPEAALEDLVVMRDGAQHQLVQASGVWAWVSPAQAAALAIPRHTSPEAATAMARSLSIARPLAEHVQDLQMRVEPPPNPSSARASGTLSSEDWERLEQIVTNVCRTMLPGVESGANRVAGEADISQATTAPGVGGVSRHRRDQDHSSGPPPIQHVASAGHGRSERTLQRPGVVCHGQWTADRVAVPNGFPAHNGPTRGGGGRDTEEDPADGTRAAITRLLLNTEPPRQISADQGARLRARAEELVQTINRAEPAQALAACVDFSREIENVTDMENYYDQRSESEDRRALVPYSPAHLTNPTHPGTGPRQAETLPALTTGDCQNQTPAEELLEEGDFDESRDASCAIIRMKGDPQMSGVPLQHLRVVRRRGLLAIERVCGQSVEEGEQMTDDEINNHPITGLLWERIYKQLTSLKTTEGEGLTPEQQGWIQLIIYFLRRMSRRNTAHPTWLWLLMPLQRCRALYHDKSFQPLFNLATTDQRNIRLRINCPRNMEDRVTPAETAAELGLDIHQELETVDTASPKEGDEISVLDQRDMDQAVRAGDQILARQMDRIQEEMASAEEGMEN